MRAADLRETLERHRRVLRGDAVHILGDERETLVATSLVAGHVMRTRLGPLATPVNCLVNAEVLLSLVHGDGDVVLEDTGSDLRVRCGRGHGSVPSQSEEPPHVPQPGGPGTSIVGEDLAWLAAALRRIALGKTKSDGSTNIESSNGEMCVCTYDEVHGAFTWRRTACDVHVGLVPADAVLLASMVSGERVALAMSADNRLLVRGEHDVLALPCIQAGAQPRADVLGDTRHHWTVQSEDLLAAIKSVAVVAKAKDAGPVRIAVDRARGLRIACSSPTGTAARDVAARVGAAHAPLNCSIELLQDVVDRIAASQVVQGWVEPGAAQSPRFILRTVDTTYVILTSSG